MYNKLLLHINIILWNTSQYEIQASIKYTGISIRNLVLSSRYWVYQSGYLSLSVAIKVLGFYIKLPCASIRVGSQTLRRMTLRWNFTFLRLYGGVLKNADSTAELTKCRLYGGCLIRKILVASCLQLLVAFNSVKNPPILDDVLLLACITSHWLF